MKRSYLWVIICFIAVMTMTACRNNTVSDAVVDEVSQKMIDDINNLGEITLEDEDQIEKLINRYATLTDAQKNAVHNYSVLLNAQDELDTIKKDQKDQKEAYLEIERKYYDEIEHGISVLKSELKNPASLDIKEIYYLHAYLSYNNSSSTYVEIVYSAKNGLGNSIDGIAEISNMNSFVGLDAVYCSTAKEIAVGQNKKINIKIGENFYSNTQDINSKEAYFSFLVDLEDFKQNKTY